jgi:hypothetical protein
MSTPPGSKCLESAITVGRAKRYTKQISEFTIEVGGSALRALHDPHDKIGQLT